MGHTAALFGGAVAVITFRIAIPPARERALETGVGLLLVLLGGRVVLRAIAAWAAPAHQHGGVVHRHGGGHAPVDGTRGWRLARRPFLVGVLHGAAGSGALMLLVLASIPSALGGLLYVLTFGVGSTAGMLLVSGCIGVPVAAAFRRSPVSFLGVQALAGAASVALGCWMVWSLGGA
jgi:hypothetical protein